MNIDIIDNSVKSEELNSEKITNVFVKCLLIGSSGVGKTAILERYTRDIFNKHFITTIGVDYRLKNVMVDNYNVKVQLWDTASQERFRCITSSYYKNSHIIIICYDITDAHSFNELEHWIEDAKKYIGESVQMAICGTKNDLILKRVISYEEGKKYAEYKNFPYFEISSKNNVGITTMFEKLLRNKISEPDFSKIIVQVDTLKENYNVLRLNDTSENNYFGYQRQCCFFY